MSSAWSLIGSSWRFTLKQPALRPVAFWLLWLPAFLGSLIMQWQATPNGTLRGGNAALLAALGSLVLLCAMLLGICCVLVIGKRLLQAKAGRNRTSFKAVRAEARGIVIPFLLTGLLQGLFITLWALLLLVPGIVYAVRTAFSPVIIASQGKAYRGALRESARLVKGRTLSTLGTLLLLAISLWLPVSLLSFLLLPLRWMPYGTVLVTAVVSAAGTMSTILWYLSLIIFYEHLQQRHAPHYVEYKPTLGEGGMEEG